MRRFAVIAGLVCLCLCLAGAVSLAAAIARGRASAATASRMVAPQTKQAPGAFAKKVQRQARRAQKARIRRAATAQASADRVRSQTEFSGQNAAEALQTTREEFPDAATGPTDADPIGDDDRVVKVGDDMIQSLFVFSLEVGWSLVHQDLSKEQRRKIAKAATKAAKRGGAISAAVSCVRGAAKI